MNKVFKVIWSDARNAYVVVSEIAKNHGSKSCSTKKLLTMLIATGVMTCASMAPAMAATDVDSGANVTIKKGAKVTVVENATVTVGEDNAIALGKGAFAVDNSIAIGNGAYTQNGNLTFGQSVALGNGAVTGAKSTSIGNNAIGGREGTITIGANAKNEALYSTVVGTDSKITSDGTAYTLDLGFLGKHPVIVQGAVSTSYGAHNTITNTGKVYSGVANSIIGSVNTVTNSNGVTIQGTGNTVTGAYKDMNLSRSDGGKLFGGDYSVLKEKESGAIAIIGGANTISNQTSSTVIGFGNTLKGENSTGVFTAGSHNTLTNVSNSLVMGDHNTLEGRKNVISLGNNNTVTADDAVAIGNGTTVSEKSGVAIGVGSVADRVAGSEKGALGAFAPANIPTAEKSTWTSTKGAVSVGDTANDITRQITNVAAGNEDTDAVNVAQLKKVNEEALKHSTVTKGDNITVTEDTNKDGGKEYNVALSNDIFLSGDNDYTYVNISGSKGSVWASSSVAAGNVIMDGTTATVSGLGNTTTAYDGFANGEGKAATEEQLKEISKVADNANQGWNLSTNGGEASKVAPGETVDFSGDKNITISNDGTKVQVELNKNLKDIETISNGDATLTLGAMGGRVSEFANGQGASVKLFGDATIINGKVNVYKDGRIAGVANGEADKDAVNVSQLHAVATEAGKHTQVKAGTNVGIVPGETEDGTHVYTVNADGTTVSGDSNVVVTAGEKDANNVTNYGVKLSKDLKGIESVSNGSAKLELSSHPIFGATAKLTNGKASVELRDSTTIINGKVQVRQDGSIGGVTAGRVDNDAVNLGQLKDVKAEALKHTTLSDGKNTTVAPTVKDGQTDYKVNVAGDLTDITSVANGDATLTLGAMGGRVSEFTNGRGASVKLFGDATIINGKVNVYKDGRIAGVANGEADKDAVNVSQLHAVATEAGKHTQVKAGTNVGIVPGETEDGTHVYTVNADGTTVSGDSNVVVTAGEKDANNVTNYGVKLSKDLKGIESVSNGSAKLELSSHPIFGATAKLTNGKASVELRDSTTIINGKVQVRQDGSIGGVTAGRVDNDAVNLGQLKDVKAEALKHTTLSDGKNTTVAPTVKDGQTDYKVNVAGDLTDITSVANGGAKLTLGGFATELANGQGASVKLFRDTTTINNAVTVYKDGRIAGVADGVNANDAVNVSQLQKAAAESATTVSDGVNTTVTATKAEDGHTDYKVNLNKDLVGIESISNGDAKLTLGGFATELANGQGASVKLFRDTTTINNAVTVYKDGRIAGVADGVNANDAVNVGQLKEAVEAGNTDTHIKAGEYGVGTDNKVNMQLVDKNGKDAGTVTIKDVAKASDVGDVNNIASDIKNKEGKTTVVDAVNNLNNKVGDLQYSKVEKGEIADGDSTTTAIGKLDQKLTDVAATAAKHTKVVNGSNITVEETAQDGQKTYKVGLNKDILLGDITGKNVSISGTNGTIETTGYIATKDRVYADKGAKLADVDITGDTISNDKSSVKLDKEGTVTINNKVTIDGNGKVSGVADGEISATSTDAVNGGQLYKTNQAIANNATNISSLSHSISNLDNRVNKVGAGAAALAALHPLDFDPDAKWDFAAGYGNYRGTNAAAVGAYYRPNEDTMFSVGGTFGNGENMVNAGVSFKLGSGSSHVSTSRVAMAKEIKELRGELEAMKSAMLDANAGKKIDTSKLQLFPDVPQNHWAYEYVTQLAGNGMIEGYPDGNFAGDRPMTRYEFAAILYRAMTKGAVLSDKILSEFSHELEYFTVDTVAKDKAGNPTIQRVRTVKANTNK